MLFDVTFSKSYHFTYGGLGDPIALATESLTAFRLCLSGTMESDGSAPCAGVNPRLCRGNTSATKHGWLAG